MAWPQLLLLLALLRCGLVGVRRQCSRLAMTYAVGTVTSSAAAATSIATQ